MAGFLLGRSVFAQRDTSRSTLQRSQNLGRTVTFCNQCGAKLEPNAKFCPSCGAEQVSAAPKTESSGPGLNWPVLGVAAVALVVASVVATLALSGSDDDGGTSGASSDEATPSTQPAAFYDSLDLSTPERCHRATFVEAFSDGDYLTAYLAMSPSAQLHAGTQPQSAPIRRTHRHIG